MTLQRHFNSVLELAIYLQIVKWPNYYKILDVNVRKFGVNLDVEHTVRGMKALSHVTWKSSLECYVVDTIYHP